MSDNLRERVARAIASVREGGWPADTYAMLQQHYLTMADAALSEIFRSDGNEEARWIEACENACPACGGSGHKGDVKPAALAEMGGVRVRDLEWRDKVYESVDEGVKIHLGPYTVRLWSGKLGARLDYLNQPLEVFPNANGLSAEVKAAAQADYEDRILAALEPAPAPSVREAAQVLLDEWREGEGPLGDLVCHSLDEGGSMQPDVDGRWIEFTKLEAALFRAIAEGKDDG